MTIFDKFVQSSRTRSGNGGTGLGLAICREIVTGHRGRIWAENSDGGGSIFYCELPLTIEPPVTKPFYQTPCRVIPDRRTSDKLIKARRSQVNQRGRILIVDDNAMNRDILCRILRKEYELDTAENGDECLRKLPEFQPQLVLLDIMMPGIDGYEVCRRIKKVPPTLASR